MSAKKISEEEATQRVEENISRNNFKDIMDGFNWMIYDMKKRQEEILRIKNRFLKYEEEDWDSTKSSSSPLSVMDEALRTYNNTGNTGARTDILTRAVVRLEKLRLIREPVKIKQLDIIWR